MSSAKNKIRSPFMTETYEDVGANKLSQFNFAALYQSHKKLDVCINICLQQMKSFAQSGQADKLLHTVECMNKQSSPYSDSTTAFTGSGCSCCM